MAVEIPPGGEVAHAGRGHAQDILGDLLRTTFADRVKSDTRSRASCDFPPHLTIAQLCLPQRLASHEAITRPWLAAL
jgi:hypothetical protein